MRYAAGLVLVTHRSRKSINLRKTLFLAPNLITLASIFCGFDSIRLSARGVGDDFYRAALLLIFALLFDTLDGRVARLTKTQSAFGLQIDSLADIISFGIAPAILLYEWSLYQVGTIGFLSTFLFVAAGSVRLARFNVLTMGKDGAPHKPSRYVIGLVIPGAAGLLVSLVLVNHAIDGNLRSMHYVWFICILIVFVSALMVSNIKFRSFKDLHVNTKTVLFVCFLVGSSLLISLQTRPAFVLLWLIACYIMLGLVEAIFRISKIKRTVAVSRQGQDHHSPHP